MENRSRATPEQFATLLEYMESHGDIARPQQGAQGKLKAERLWLELSELLNSIGGGVMKSVEKWKKVWADWKAKTKKKALVMRREASGTGGGPSSRQSLTALEQRVLGIMGLTAVIGLVGIQERGFDEPTAGPSERRPPPTMDAVHSQSPSQTATEPLLLDFIPMPESTASSSALSHLASEGSHAPPVRQMPTSPARVLMTPPPPEPIPSAASPNTTGARETVRPRRRRLQTSQSPAVSTPRRETLLRARTRRVQTPFEQATNQFVAVENRRLQLEEDRERNFHQRETRRMDMEETRTNVLTSIGQVLDSLAGILRQLRPSSLVSTDILSSNPSSN